MKMDDTQAEDDAVALREWQPIETVQISPRPFLALNHDGEIWLARRDRDHEQRPVFVYRTNALRSPRSYRIHEIDGKRLLEELDGRERDEWQSAWTYWTNGYDFRPTHWMRLPSPPPTGEGTP